jgi:hypothetical protein
VVSLTEQVLCEDVLALGARHEHCLDNTRTKKWEELVCDIEYKDIKVREFMNMVKLKAYVQEAVNNGVSAFYLCPCFEPTDFKTTYRYIFNCVKDVDEKILYAKICEKAASL